MSNMSEVIKKVSYDYAYNTWGSNHLSVPIPSWSNTVIIDVSSNGGAQELANQVRVRFNSDSGNSYARAIRYYTTSYAFVASTLTYHSGILLPTNGDVGTWRLVVYPIKDAAQYTHTQEYIHSPSSGYKGTIFNRWLNTVDDVTSIQIYWGVAGRQSADITVRALR